MNKKTFRWLSLFILALFCKTGSAMAQDTLRVMAYNVLNYGQYPLCQGPNSTYHGYLKTIVQFANPDLLSLEKMGSIKTGPSDFHYSAAVGFQDSILQYALNAAYPGRYVCCPFTNAAASPTFSILFYDQQKLGFLNIVCSYASTEDFNTYKFYYKDPNLASTHDTTYLYVTVNHDISGDGNESLRGAQITGEMSQIRSRFTHLANMINMGDFNVRNSTESCYQTLAAPADTNFRYFDPPFHPDGNLTYPANWDANPGSFAPYLTTSTRSSGSVPNSCGTSGGGKSWYDHIFLSPWIVNNANYISYIPNSYRTIGNDGHRVGISANASPTNTSAPSTVVNALFQMSNKYPVMVDLAVTPNTTGSSLPDPEITPSAVANISRLKEQVTVVNPAAGKIILRLSEGLIGQTMRFECADISGRVLISEELVASSGTAEIDNEITPGVYFIKVSGTQGVYLKSLLLKQ